MALRRDTAGRPAGGTAVGLWLVALACAGPPAAQAEPAEVAAAWKALQAAARTECRQDADCRSLGVGALACGGPQAFLPWSAAVSDEPVLQAAARRYASTRQKQIAATGELSTCVVLDDPGAICQRAPEAALGHCVLGRHRAAGQLR